MLFADVTNDPISIGNWILNAAAIFGFISAPIGIALMVKKLLERKRNTEYITREEFSKLEISISHCVTKSEFQELKTTVSLCATRSELDEIRKIIEKTDTYIHESMHRFSGVLEAVPLKVEILMKGHDKLEAAIADSTKKLERLLTYWELLRDPAFMKKITEKQE